MSRFNKLLACLILLGSCAAETEQAISKEQPVKPIAMSDSTVIVMLGDSHIANFKWDSAFADVKLVNHGIGGDFSANLLNRIDNSLALHPKKIFIEIGANDLFLGVRPEQIIKNLDQLIGLIRAHEASPEVFIHSIIPNDLPSPKSSSGCFVWIRSTNKLLQEYCSRESISYIDVFTPLSRERGLDPRYDSGDQLHLNALGYAVWVDQLREYLN